MNQIPLSSAQRANWLRLIRSENIGPVTFFSLLRHFATVEEALERAPELSRKGGRARPIRIAAKGVVEDEISALEKAGGTLIAFCEPAYPKALAVIHDPPPVIQIRGHAALLNKRSVGIVGARNASAAGRRFTREIAADIGRADYAVISGMARGIDTAAHEGAMPTGTVAAVAGGVDVVYPRENAALYEDIVARGAIISEQPFGTRPTARHFPPRNRLISGLSLGTLVVEAAPRSGSLITARMALEQGREVFAVPGSPLDPRYKGTNGLIRQGAILTESAGDITEHLSAMSPTPLAEGEKPGILPLALEIPSEQELSSARDGIINLLGPVAITVDELLRECQLSPAVILTVLLELELAGRLDRHPGNRVSLVL
jgi:DNA processing protein